MGQNGSAPPPGWRSVFFFSFKNQVVPSICDGVLYPSARDPGRPHVYRTGPRDYERPQGKRPGPGAIAAGGPVVVAFSGSFTVI